MEATTLAIGDLAAPKREDLSRVASVKLHDEPFADCTLHVVPGQHGLLVDSGFLGGIRQRDQLTLRRGQDAVTHVSIYLRKASHGHIMIGALSGDAQSSGVTAHVVEVGFAALVGVPTTTPEEQPLHTSHPKGTSCSRSSSPSTGLTPSW